jgi:ribonucleoside-diphosphate reductase alpha subunit
MATNPAQSGNAHANSPRRKPRRFGRNSLQVINRDGDRELLEFDRITERNAALCEPIFDNSGRLVAPGLSAVNSHLLTIEITRTYSSDFERGELRTSDIDAIVVDHLVNTAVQSVHRTDLAARLIVSNLHHTTPKTFVACLEGVNRVQNGRMDPAMVAFARTNSGRIESMLDHDRDYRFDYPGLRMLLNSYLCAAPVDPAADEADSSGFASGAFRSQHGEVIIERVQHCFMRLALWLGMWFLDCPPEALNSSYLAHVEADANEAEAHALPDTAETRTRMTLAFTAELYEMLSKGCITFGSPFFFNAGTTKARIASCFLLRVGDSNESIHHTLAQVATGMGGGGGVGLSWDAVRANGAYIRGSGGYSTGVPSWWQEYRPVRKYVNQGGNKRPGAIAMYHAFWHPDTPELLVMPRDSSEIAAAGENTPDLKTGYGVEDVYFDLFDADAEIALLPPEKHPELAELTGDAWRARFTELQEFYRLPEHAASVRWTRVRQLERARYQTTVEKGFPYLFHRTNANNLCNLSVPNASPPMVVNCSNLCAEILIPTRAAHPERGDGADAAGETGVCVLATVNVPAFLTRDADTDRRCDCDPSAACDCHLFGPPPRATGVDFDLMTKVAGLLTVALDIAIDRMWFSPFMKDARRSIDRHRTIGVGMMGLVGAMQELRLPFEGSAAVDLSGDAALAIYVGACEASARMAQCIGPYPSMRDTRDAEGRRLLHSVERGQLQPDVAQAHGFVDDGWEGRLAARPIGRTVTPARLAALRRLLRTHGQRNGLLTSGQPTASNSLIHGVTPGTDVPNSLAYTRKVGAGVFLVTCRALHDEARRLGLDADQLLRRVSANGGSVAGLDGVPDSLLRCFRTAYEVDPVSMVVHAAKRQGFTTQSQSTNLYLTKFKMAELYGLHKLGSQLGLCTFYYVYGQGGTSAMSVVKKERQTDLPPKPSPEIPSAGACKLRDPNSSEPCSACEG